MIRPEHPFDIRPASDLQLMLDVTNSFANREKYVIHPEKSTIIIRIPKKSTRFEATDWKLCVGFRMNVSNP
jgi:hypothetical protein